MEQETKQILMRAELTDEEWKAIRKAAIDAESGNAEFVGQILRLWLKAAQVVA